MILNNRLFPLLLQWHPFCQELELDLIPTPTRIQLSPTFGQELPALVPTIFLRQIHTTWYPPLPDMRPRPRHSPLQGTQCLAVPFQTTGQQQTRHRRATTPITTSLMRGACQSPPRPLHSRTVSAQFHLQPG